MTSRELHARAWLAWLAAFALLEAHALVANRRRGGDAPRTLSDLAALWCAHPWRKRALALGWLWLGWHWLGRPPLPTVRPPS